MSIVNPTGLLYFDVLYYFMIIYLGPGTAFYLLFFRNRENKLMNSYWESGVEILGLVTHRKITILRPSLPPKHEICFAYKPPGYDTVYVKDFIVVDAFQFHRRVIPVMILPGQPESGMAKFKLRTCLGSAPALYGCWVLSIFFVIYCTVVFALLIAFEFETDAQFS
jgi:hypothetical protein